jgi:hypothetical protein
VQIDETKIKIELIEQKILNINEDLYIYSKNDDDEMVNLKLKDFMLNKFEDIDPLIKKRLKY